MKESKQGRLRTWELEYLEGGRELVSDLGGGLVLGHNFAFLCPGWSNAPLVASILDMVEGKKPGPRTFALWGEGLVDLPGVSLRQRPPLHTGVWGLWTEKPSVRVGEVARAFVFAPLHAGEHVEVQLAKDGESLGLQKIPVDPHGIGPIELQGLPPGNFQLALPKQAATCKFRVVYPRTRSLTGTWIQQYIQNAGLGRYVFVFVVQLESFGAPLRGEVGINLIDEGQEPMRPISGEVFRPDGAGRIAGELPFAGEGPFSLEVQSLVDPERRCFLRVPLEDNAQTEAEEEDGGEVLANVLGGVQAWRWADGMENQPFGFAAQALGEQRNTPIQFVGASQGEARFLAQASADEVIVTVLDPVRGECSTHHWPQLAASTSFEVPIPDPAAVLAVGGFVGGRPWEGWATAIAPEALDFKMTVPTQVAPNTELEIRLESYEPQGLPVFVNVREHDPDEPATPWGPAQTLQEQLVACTQTMPVGFASDPLHRVRPITPTKTAETGETTGEFEAPAPLPDGWQPPVPEEEHFEKTLYCDVIHVKGEERLRLPLGDEQGFYKVEAVALQGPAWSYASSDVKSSLPTFAEILAPRFVHEEDVAFGELIVATEEDKIRISCWRDGEPIELYKGKDKVAPDDWCDGPVCELRFAALAGHYVIKIHDAQEEELDALEATINPWGRQKERRHGLALLPEGSQLPDHLQDAEDLTPLPGLGEWMRGVARAIVVQPPGNCEQEAARVTGAVHWLRYAQSKQDAQEAMRFLKMGLERLEGLLLPRMGFRLLPEGGQDPHWGKEAVRHLWEVELPPLEDDLPFAMWIDDIRALAKEAAKGYRLPHIPDRITTCRDAYRVFWLEQIAARKQEAVWECHKRILEQGGRWGVWGEDAVESRQESCYAAAVLLEDPQHEHTQLGWKVANGVLSALRDQGQLYANSDNIGLLALLAACQRALSPPDQAAVQWDGGVADWLEVIAQEPDLKDLKVLKGTVALAYGRTQETDLETFARPVPWEVTLLRTTGPREPVQEADIGERLQLAISLPEGSQLGDLLEIYLPRALSCLATPEEGAGPVVLILQECTQLEIPLAAIEPTVGFDGSIGPQRWGVRLRNFYHEERGASEFSQGLTIWPPGKRRRRLRDQLSQGWKKIFG